MIFKIIQGHGKTDHSTVHMLFHITCQLKFCLIPFLIIII